MEYKQNKFKLDVSDINQDFSTDKITFQKVAGSLVSPIHDLKVVISGNSFNKDLSVMGFIGKDIYNARAEKFNIDSLKGSYNLESVTDEYFIIQDETNNPEFIVRKVDNFGIYVFAGRHDLAINGHSAPYLAFDNIENFKNKLIKFANLLELLVNGVYRENNIELENDIRYRIDFKADIAESDTVNSKEKDIPQALKRFYNKIGKV